MTDCVNEDEVELSLGLAIGCSGRLRKCSESDVVVKHDGVLGRHHETKKKQEVRRGGTIRVEEDERVRKKAKSEFRFEYVDEGSGSFSSGDCDSLSGQRKCPSDDIKEQILCSIGLNSTSPEAENLSSSTTPDGIITNLQGQCKSSQTVMMNKERSVTLPFVPSAKMPYVSTTGNCPGGKIVNGFLYRYTKEEVCIVCVCHGFLFSPAKFVEHAGGINVENPLRHITVTSFTSPAP